MSDGWGPGDKINDPGFELGYLDDGLPYELFFGEYPHSRQDNNIYARFSNKVGTESERVVGFAGHRIQVKIELRTMNYLKTSWMSGDEVRKGGEWRIWLNGYEVYSQFTRDPFEALLTIREKLHKLMDLPVSLWKGETPVGRKIYFSNQPGIITSWIPEQGCVIIKPDGIAKFDPSPWNKDEVEELDMIKDDILSSNIWWWRDE